MVAFGKSAASASQAFDLAFPADPHLSHPFPLTFDSSVRHHRTILVVHTPYPRGHYTATAILVVCQGPVRSPLLTRKQHLSRFLAYKAHSEALPDERLRYPSHFGIGDRLFYCYILTLYTIENSYVAGGKRTQHTFRRIRP